MMRFCLVAAILIGTAAISAGASNPNTKDVPAFPGTLANARYVYVASYDGDQFDTNLLPEDRNAITSVQNAIQSWRKLIIVYHPSEADIVVLVTSRPSEDLLAVYDAHQGPTSNFLWRVMEQGGLQSGETPLVTQFTKGFDSVRKHKQVCGTLRGAQTKSMPPSQRTAHSSNRSNRILCNLRRPRFSPSVARVTEGLRVGVSRISGD